MIVNNQQFDRHQVSKAKAIGNKIITRVKDIKKDARQNAASSNSSQPGPGAQQLPGALQPGVQPGIDDEFIHASGFGLFFTRNDIPSWVQL